ASDAPLRFAAENNPPGIHLFLVFDLDKLSPEEALEVERRAGGIRAVLPEELPNRWWLGSQGIEALELKVRAGNALDVIDSTRGALSAISNGIPANFRETTGFVGALMFEFQMPE